LLEYEDKPKRRILSKKARKLLWTIVLHKERIDEAMIGKLWLLSSGAANMLGFKANDNYYANLRD